MNQAAQRKTEEQILARLAEINTVKLALSDSIDRAPSEFQESTSGDDDSIESEALQQKLGEMSREREELEIEEADLRQMLATYQKAA